MPVAHALLESLRSFGSQAMGIRESFLDLQVGGARTFGVLATSLGSARDIGWVVCHSFAMEQFNLQPLEVATARRLAALGFPVLRFHAQGYGDSERPIEEARVASQVRDTVEAVAAVRSSTGVRRVGLVGGRLGGTVAALAASTFGADALVLWEPVVSGERYLRSLVTPALASELVGRGRPRSSARSPFDEIGTAGVIEVEGLPLGRELIEEVRALDLLSSLRSFQSRALVVQVSPSSEPRRDLEQLVARLASLGTPPAFEVVADPRGGSFGQLRYRLGRDGRKVDTQAALSERLTDLTVAWCRGLDEAIGAGGPGER
jgi:pimeloyl-ACP methyl ester carboxylesterase